MERIGNVEVFTDDEEIIDVLAKLPAMEHYGNLNILEYIERKTDKSDFGSVFNFNNVIYVLYKFDRHLIDEENAGMVLTLSLPAFVTEQIAIWRLLKEQGASFSDKIFKSLTEALIAQQVLNKISG